MEKEKEYVELELVPEPPDTVSTIKGNVQGMIEDILKDAGQGDLLNNKEFIVKVEKTFPTDEAIIVGLEFLSGAALIAFKDLVLPKLKKKFKKAQKRKKSKKK